MATMFPDIDPALIENSGEQRFYEAAATLPDAYSLMGKGMAQKMLKNKLIDRLTGCNYNNGQFDKQYKL